MRALSRQYLINPNTVVRAYLELERGGLIYKKRGMGTYVGEKAVTMSQQEKLEIVRKLLDKALVEAIELGLSAAEMHEVFRERLSRFGKKGSTGRKPADD